jgi:NitT/TauT family transport system substrate-binding protein
MASAIALTACGGSDTSTTTGSTGGLEKTTVKIGTMPIPDFASLQIAIDKGFFKAEGLTVETSIEQGTAKAIPKLTGGSLDVVMANYVSTFSAQQAGLGKFKIIADAAQAVPDTFVLMVPKGSPIKTVPDLAGKKIAVPTVNNIATLAVTQTLKVGGVAVKPEQFAVVPFPEMIGALKNGSVDAAWITEPFITVAQKTMGAQKIADTMTGPTADFPIAGWAVTEEFATKNPKTTAAIQRALLKANQLAASDRKVVEEALPKYTKIDSATAAVITLVTYPTTLSDTRLQRVADLMTELGLLPGQFDVKPLIMAPPAG